jgi:two-component system response regulator NreC
MARIRVLVADDHGIVRAGVRLLVDAQPDMTVVGEAADGLEVLRQVAQLHPDVVLMDVAMPRLGGVEATRRLRTAFPQVRVLALTMLDNERYFFQLLQAGAAGYVVKGGSPEDLLTAIRAVSEGQVYLHPTVTRFLVEDYLRRLQIGEEGDSYARLTDREREVLHLLAEGKKGREIAEELQVSPYTVERHRANIMAKLNLHNRADLIKYAIRKGLIDVEQ